MQKLRLVKFARRDRGAAVVEFALLLGPFLILVLGMLQIGVIFLANRSVDAALEDISRQVRVGAIQSGLVPQNQFVAQLCRQIVIIPDCATTIQLRVQAFPDPAATLTAGLFDATSNFPIINGIYDTGNPNNIVVVAMTVEPPLAPFAGTLLPFGGPGSGFRIAGATVFQNESFTPGVLTPQS